MKNDGHRNHTYIYYTRQNILRQTKVVRETEEILSKAILKYRTRGTSEMQTPRALNKYQNRDLAYPWKDHHLQVLGISLSLSLWPSRSGINSEIVNHLTFGRTPWAADRPIAMTLPTQDSTMKKHEYIIPVTSGILTRVPSTRAVSDHFPDKSISYYGRIGIFIYLH
jgi:hypothetical protein